MTEIRTRFAPSPTGYMHVGNLRTALFAYLIAKSKSGKFILRIEDTDQKRLNKDATRVIYQTLLTCGIVHDEGENVGGEYGPYVQSERKKLGIYHRYAEELIQKKSAYYCFCGLERGEGEDPCKNLHTNAVNEKIQNGSPYVIRQVVPNEGVTSFADEVYGTVTVENQTLSEGVLIKQDGFPTYNFANVIDDHLMQITHVVRGDEYLSSTPKYILLYQAFGWDVPVHIHLPPIMRDSTHKFSKRNGDPSFEELLSKGYLNKAVLNYIALLGWSPPQSDREIFTLDDLIHTFSLEGISKSPAIFDEQKLSWMNGEYIRALSVEEFTNIAQPYLPKTLNPKQRKYLAELLQKRTKTLLEIPEQVDFIDTLPTYDTALYVHKKMKTNKELSLQILLDTITILSNVETWTSEAIHDILVEYAKQKGYKNGQVMYPIRLAISGKASTPGGATELAVLFGKTETLSRIKQSIHLLEKERN